MRRAPRAMPLECTLESIYNLVNFQCANTVFESAEQWIIECVSNGYEFDVVVFV